MMPPQTPKPDRIPELVAYLRAALAIDDRICRACGCYMPSGGSGYCSDHAHMAIALDISDEDTQRMTFDTLRLDTDDDRTR